MSRAWCNTCGRMVEVEDSYRTSEMTARGEVEFTAICLACGHSKSGPETIVAAAPGRPYVGPQVAVARNLKPSELRAADHQQRVIDERNDHD